MSCGRSICLGMDGFPDLLRRKNLRNRSKKVFSAVTPCMGPGAWRSDHWRASAGLTSDEESRFSGFVGLEVVSLAGSTCFSADRISAEAGASSGSAGGGLVWPSRGSCFPGDWIPAEKGRSSGPIVGGLVLRFRRRKTSVKTAAITMIMTIKSSHSAAPIIQPSFALEGDLLVRILRFEY